MAFTASDEGIRYSKLFKSVMMPFSEIKSIVITDESTTVMTKSGKSCSHKEFAPVCLQENFCKNVVKHNIEYLNDTEEKYSGAYYCLDEAEPIVKAAAERAKSYGEDIVRSKLGSEYGFEPVIKSDVDECSMSFCLTKDGVPAFIPEGSKTDDSDGIPNSFDVIVLYFLVEWDPLSGTGKYAVTGELKYDEVLKQYFERNVTEFCDEYLEWRDKNG